MQAYPGGGAGPAMPLNLNPAGSAIVPPLTLAQGAPSTLQPLGVGGEIARFEGTYLFSIPNKRVGAPRRRALGDMHYCTRVRSDARARALAFSPHAFAERSRIVRISAPSRA